MGAEVSQSAANVLSNFDVQRFRLAAVTWLVENNHPLREFETESFKRMLCFANPAAEEALWASYYSVARFVIRLYDHLKLIVKAELATAVSKVHISFDGWTTKGGKRGFFGVVAHYANTEGKIVDLPIALPQLAGVHSGEAIGDCVSKALSTFGITPSRLGYFVLDNATANDVAIESLAKQYGFVASWRRLRCGPHTLNLVGQTVMFGKDKDAYDNDPRHEKTEEKFMAEWRRLGPLGVFLDVINHISTPKQHFSFARFQHLAHDEDSTNNSDVLKSVVKACITRWNSYCAAFERGLTLRQPITAYSNHHIAKVAELDRTAIANGNKLPAAPAWMRSDGLTTADWAVITEYVEVLRPLKTATERLEGRGSKQWRLNGRFGAIYEVIPTFEQLIAAFEDQLVMWEKVDFEQLEAPEDHMAINLRAAVAKLKLYYSKLSDSPAYYAAIVLHPRYRNYCKLAWAHDPARLAAADAAFQQLWRLYNHRQAPRAQLLKPTARGNAIDDAINAILEAESDDEADSSDEYERWRANEPRWSRADFEQQGNPVRYWLALLPKYPALAQLALDIMTIPASSCECERLFSELGDLLEPRRRKIGSNLLAALQCVRRWMAAGLLDTDDTVNESTLTDNDIDSLYGVRDWDDSS